MQNNMHTILCFSHAHIYTNTKKYCRMIRGKTEIIEIEKNKE